MYRCTVVYTYSSIHTNQNKTKHRNKSLLEKHQDKVIKEEKTAKKARAGKPPERVPWSRCVVFGVGCGVGLLLMSLWMTNSNVFVGVHVCC